MSSGKGHNPWLAISRMFGETIAEHCLAVHVLRGSSAVDNLLLAPMERAPQSYPKKVLTQKPEN